MIANIDASESFDNDPSQVCDDDEDNIEINVIISGIKQLGMALEREMPNEWNRFINACSIKCDF